MAVRDFGMLLQFASSLADDARAIARRFFRGDDGAEQKDDRTPVTKADRAIERRWRERIAAEFPHDGVLGEEEGAVRLDAEWLWVLDPIDGTKAFASGNPMFGSLLGLMHRGDPVLGVLDAPALGERWLGARGLGASRDGAPIRVRAPRPLGRAVMYCTTPDPMRQVAGFERLRQHVQWTVYGGDCISYALVASGTADLVVDRGLKPYDWCALVPIVTEAGGVMVDWEMAPLGLGSSGAVITAASRELAQAASAELVAAG